MAKRQAGDRWGLSCTNTETGVTKPVQIGGWEDSTFPYRKQAEVYAKEFNENAKTYGDPKVYAVVFAGNREGL